MNRNHLALLDAGYTLVAASHRLARHLRHQYTQLQLERGSHAWATPDIIPWQAWLQRCWEEHAVHGTPELLLNAYQEQLLWQEIIARSSRTHGLLQPANTAKRVMEAWSSLHQFLIPLFPRGTFLNEDARVFKSWADAFRSECERNNWCGSDVSIDILTRTVTGGERNIVRGDIALIGFERITPQQQRFFDALASTGCTVRIVKTKPKKDRVTRVTGFADAKAEIRAAAGWARGILEREIEPRIGIVVPDLPGRRRELIRQFEDCLLPGRLIGTEDGIPPFSLSLGLPLTDYPLIESAFLLLALDGRPVPVPELGSLLRSPFLRGAESERLQRAHLDARLRENGESRLTPGAILAIAGSLPENHRPTVFLSSLAAARDYLDTLPRRASPDQWAGSIAELLKLFGWPGERTLDSDEYQVLDAWREAVRRFVSLQLVARDLPWTDAVNRLRRVAAAFSFQPETEETPIQVMGVTGAADMGFDHLWIMSMDEETWPPPVRPNPFIPLELQRQHGLPWSTAELVLDQARDTLDGLAASADNTVISYPCNAGERSLRPCPLLRNYESGDMASDIEPMPDYRAIILAAADMEDFTDEQAPPPGEDEYASGGTAVFRDQSACPFRAFARYRLHARALDAVDIGLDPRERGLLIHRVMHLLWQRLASRDRLMGLDETALQALLDEVIDDTVENVRKRQPRTWTDRFMALEKARLKRILLEWLEQERQRGPFEVIACEEDNDIVFEGIAMKTRIDRIDRLPDGGEVIIDYKSGEAGVGQWLGERPDDPQLPLYTLGRDADIAGVAYARLKRGKDFGYQGLARDAGILPGTDGFSGSRYAKHFADPDNMAPEWTDLIAVWRTVLQQLAAAFRAGDARVDPKNAQSCRYCDQHPFCRIHELAAANNGPETDDD